MYQSRSQTWSVSLGEAKYHIQTAKITTKLEAEATTNATNLLGTIFVFLGQSHLQLNCQRSQPCTFNAIWGEQDLQSSLKETQVFQISISIISITCPNGVLHLLI